ncbi:MAG: DinB family protein [Chitinophagaceae bacterium]|nr:DinB family protein [Chitinophagaceae bacterium]
MNKEVIIRQLKVNHQSFVDQIVSLNETAFNFSKEGKWNAGQTLDHLARAVSTLRLAMLLPKQVFALLYGKANRPSKDYEGLVAKYQQKLAAGGKAHGRYLPVNIPFNKRKKNADALQKSVITICRRLNGYSETALDTYILPHPLLGKITMREMMYFTIYHAQHHLQIVKRDLAG